MLSSDTDTGGMILHNVYCFRNQVNLYLHVVADEIRTMASGAVDDRIIALQVLNLF